MNIDQECRLEIAKMNDKAENAVNVAVTAAFATCAAPIPFADMPMLVAEQVTLMATICGIYGINVKKDGLKMLATTAISAGGAAVLGKSIVTGIMKLIPGIGSVIGGAISAGTASVITLAMGRAFIEVCKMVKLGKLSEAELVSKKGKDIFTSQFASQMKKSKNAYQKSTNSLNNENTLLAEMGETWVDLDKL